MGAIMGLQNKSHGYDPSLSRWGDPYWYVVIEVNFFLNFILLTTLLYLKTFF